MGQGALPLLRILNRRSGCPTRRAAEHAEPLKMSTSDRGHRPGVIRGYALAGRQADIYGRRLTSPVDIDRSFIATFRMRCRERVGSGVSVIGRLALPGNAGYAAPDAPTRVPDRASGGDG